MNQPILSIHGLSVKIPFQGQMVAICRDVSLDLYPGQILGLAGESGSGKTITALALTGLLPKDSKISFQKYDLFGSSISAQTPQELQKLRGRVIGYCFQEAGSCFNPLLSIGAQIVETIECHRLCGRKEAQREAFNLLEQVRLDQPKKTFNKFSHELSGGMAQRAMIAMALSSRPRILIADEPTTALDALTREAIARLFSEISKKTDLAILWISHDLKLLSRYSQNLSIMLNGKIVETGKTNLLYQNPQHPFTQTLRHEKKEWCKVENSSKISENSSSDQSAENLCPFFDRCDQRVKECQTKQPEILTTKERRKIRCFLAQKN